MRLSQKFFAITYCIVLLFCGIGGSVLVHYASSLLYQNREASLKQTSTYVLESFLSLADLGSGLYDQTELDQMTRQISQEMGNASCQIQIRPYDETENLHLGLGYLDYQPAQSMMYSLSRVEVSNQNYLIQVRMDLKDFERQTHLLWYVYMLMVLVMALTSGLVLNRVANRLAKPINQLSLGAKQIAKGQYAKQVLIQSHDQELQQLADSFNHMSLMVEKNIQEVTRQANQRDLFVANFTHEMKTPLAVIRGFAENLEENVNSEKRKYYLQQIIGQTERMDDMVKEMVCISRLDSEGYSPVKEQISVREMINGIISAYGAQIEEKQIELSVSCSEDFLIHGDRGMVEKAFSSLIANAAAHNRYEGKIRIDIEKNRCVIQNTGEKIPEEDLPYVCDLFFTGSKSRDTGEKHLGVGLYLADKIFRANGLGIKVENTEDGVRVTCEDIPGLCRIVFNLAADIRHVDTQDLVVAVCVGPPHIGQDRSVGDDFAGILGEVGNDLILNGRQVDDLAANCEQALGEI